LLSVTGSGYCNLLFMKMSDLAGEVKVTIDGYSETHTIDLNAYVCMLTRYQNNADFWFFRYLQTQVFRMYFQNEFKVEFRKTTGTTAYAKCLYGVI